MCGLRKLQTSLGCFLRVYDTKIRPTEKLINLHQLPATPVKAGVLARFVDHLVAASTHRCRTRIQTSNVPLQPTALTQHGISWSTKADTDVPYFAQQKTGTGNTLEHTLAQECPPFDTQVLHS